MASQNEDEQYLQNALTFSGWSEKRHYFLRIDGGRFFRDRWIDLVKRHYPGTPPAKELRSWEDLEPWEQENAIKVYELVQHLAWTVGWPIDGLSREQKGRFVYTCMIAQVWKRIPQGEEAHLVDWDQLPAWQQESYADIFENIEWYQEVGDVPDYVHFLKESPFS